METPALGESPRNSTCWLGTSPCWERWRKKCQALHSHSPLRKMEGGAGGGKRGKNQHWGTLQVLVTLTKWHEANSSQAFKDSQVILHMYTYCYWVYCYKGKGRLDAKVVKVIDHSQGSIALISDMLNRTYLLGTFILKLNGTGTANPNKWMQLSTSLISQLECQPAGEKM